MDDTERTEQPTAEFTFAGNTLTVRQPTDSQYLVLALTRQPAQSDREGMARVVRRLSTVLESLVGTQQWDDLIEGPMIRGDDGAGPKEFTDLVLRVVQHKYTPAEPEPDDEPTAEELEMIRKLRAGKKSPGA